MLKLIIVITNYLKDVKKELKKVIWPNKQAVVKMTSMVIVVSTMVGGIIAVLDFGFTKSIAWLLKLK